MNRRHVLTTEELAEMRAALADPDYLSRMIADAKRSQMVEVDNPFRTELRPRRGTA